MKAEDPGEVLIMEHFLLLCEYKIIPLQRNSSSSEKLALWENEIKIYIHRSQKLELNYHQEITMSQDIWLKRHIAAWFVIWLFLTRKVESHFTALIMQIRVLWSCINTHSHIYQGRRRDCTGHKVNVFIVFPQCEADSGIGGKQIKHFG